MHTFGLLNVALQYFPRQEKAICFSCTTYKSWRSSQSCVLNCSVLCFCGRRVFIPMHYFYVSLQKEAEVFARRTFPVLILRLSVPAWRGGTAEPCMFSAAARLLCARRMRLSMTLVFLLRYCGLPWDGWMQEARAAAVAEGLRVLSAAPRGHPAALLGWNSLKSCSIV